MQAIEQIASPQIQSAKDDQELPWDILIALIPLLTTKADLSRLMRSCMTLHEYMLPFLARQCLVKSWEGVASLWEFVRSNPGRYLLIEDLELPNPSALGDIELPGTQKALMMAVSVVANASKLQTLRLHGVDTLLSSCQILLPAIVSLPDLKAVYFDEIGNSRGAALLGQMTCPLHRIVLDFGYHILSDESLPQPDLFQLLAPSEQTLEELTLIDTPTQSTFSQPINSNVRFTRVHTLIIDVGWMDGCIAAIDLPFAFPNLKTLIWRSEQDDYPEDIEDQRGRYLDRADEARGSWDILDVLDCDACWVYNYAFRYPLRLWSGVVLGRHEKHLSYFRTVLATIRPKHLDVALLVQYLRVDLDHSLDVFPPSEITHLNVSFNNYTENDTDPGRVVVRRFKEYMSQLHSGFKHMPALQFLSLRFQFDLPTLAECGPFVAFGFGALDAGAYTRKLAEHLPELKHVAFQFRHFPELDACWAITRQPLDVVKLTKDAAHGVLCDSPFAEKLCGRLAEEEANVNLQILNATW
ncbi:hypothetical protein EIP91_007324 [Steccherinum ochraceum]|uniref:F-box domain-containing protein n=1 Tax=Steccherinum ochraceum TaxID=92696 RepID=A0A4V6N7B5_9APHY|nr:hypothetical protein EIP91_007324 [Steccherinum ochraceum]